MDTLKGHWPTISSLILYIIIIIMLSILATELWLPETFVITLCVKVVSQIQVILWLE